MGNLPTNPTPSPSLSWVVGSKIDLSHLPYSRLVQDLQSPEMYKINQKYGWYAPCKSQKWNIYSFGSESVNFIETIHLYLGSQYGPNNLMFRSQGPLQTSPTSRWSLIYLTAVGDGKDKQVCGSSFLHFTSTGV